MADEVDRIVEAWRRERPDLDVAPMEVLSRVSRLARQLDLARKSTFAAHGLDMWAFEVLSALRRSGTPYCLSPSQLLTQTLVTSGTMTNRIDRLVETGLVERHPDPDDRRGVLVRLTDTGRSKVDGSLSDLLLFEKELLADLGSMQQKKLADLLRILSTGFESEDSGAA